MKRLARPAALPVLIVALLSVALGIAVVLVAEDDQAGVTDRGSAGGLKLYWFIPDGLRAEPTTFQIYEWAKAGKLPNIKKMMERGAYGYSKPVFPGHTPTNFATLLTGTTPKVHGVADGPMHIEGYPLNIVSKGGFSSVAKKVPPIWFTLEKHGELVSVLSVPGSTPPELSRGIVIRGRWGGWGLDFPAIVFHTSRDRELRVLQGPGNKLFEFGSELTKFVPSTQPTGWQLALPASFSPPREIRLENWEATVYGYLYDSRDDGEEAYDRVLLSKDKTREWAHLREGEWSDWLPIRLRYQTTNDYQLHTPKKMRWERELGAISVDTNVRVKVVKLGARDFFRVRFLYDGLNRYSVKPSYLADAIGSALGPMTDFVDNFPPQLIYYPEDKQAFIEEARMSLDWHREAARYLIEEIDSNVVIHDIYTPNQMLTSRWWLGYLDPRSPRYGRVADAQREQLWTEVLDMYKGIDAIIGEILEHADADTYIVLSSDHGAVPLFKEVRLNNLFASNGLLEFDYDRDTGEYVIDWKRSKAVFLKMDGIYLNPAGLHGNYERASGPEYESLRDRVIRLLEALIDEDGRRPLAAVVKWEDAGSLGLPTDRVGDLIVSNVAGYGWVEDLTEDRSVFVEATKTGYKQAVLPDEEQGMWTPFMVVGPGVKRGHRIEQPIRHVDQYPTIMKLLGRDRPSFVEGRAVPEVFSIERQ